jgi:hypothetical protein
LPLEECRQNYSQKCLCTTQYASSTCFSVTRPQKFDASCRLPDADFVRRRPHTILNTQSGDHGKFEKSIDECKCFQIRHCGASYSTHASHTRTTMACRSEVPGARGSLRPRFKLINAYVYSMTSRYANDEVTVNPAWGLTKTGAPRKRLSQACLSVYTIAHDSLLD